MTRLDNGNNGRISIACCLCILACLITFLFSGRIFVSYSGESTPRSPVSMTALMTASAASSMAEPFSRAIPAPRVTPEPGPVSALTPSCPEGGAPLGELGRTVCQANHWVARTVAALVEWLARGWPLAGLVTLVGMLGALGVLLRALRRLRAAEGAVWLQITPPASMPPGGAVGLWRMLAGCLRHAPRPVLGPSPHLAVEWWADPSGLRAGLWVPAAVRPGRVADAITRAWPGAQVGETHPPVWHRYPTRLLELVPAQGPWAPLIDPTRHARPGEQPTSEPLRAVLGALGERAPGEQACVQLIVSTHPGRPSGIDTGPAGRVGGGVSGGGAAGMLRAAVPALLGTLAGALAALTLGVLDFLTGHTSSRRPAAAHRPTSASGGDSVAASARAAVAAKRGTGPHLRATLRIAVSVPMPTRWGHDRAEAVDIATGYELVTPALRLRWRRFWAAERITLRTHSPAAWVATLAELSALWHLPSEPARYRLAAPGAQRIQARGATRHLPDRPAHRPGSATHPPTDNQPGHHNRGRHGDRHGDGRGGGVPRGLPPSPPRRPGRPDTPPPAPHGHGERRAPGAGPADTRPPSGPAPAARLAAPPTVSRLPRPARRAAAPAQGDNGGEPR